MMTRPPLFPVRSAEETQKLMHVALGKASADLVVADASLVNVYTGEIIDRCSVSTKGPWIAGVGEDLAHAIGPDTRVIDARGKTLIPGFIEGHTHLAWLYTIDAFLPYAMRGGTTTIITETLEPYPVAGTAGVIDLLESFQGQPIKILGTAPPHGLHKFAVQGNIS